MHYPRKIVIRKMLLVMVRVRIMDKFRVWLESGLGLRLGLTKKDSLSYLKTIVLHIEKILFCAFTRHRIKHGSHGIG